jgi:redox-sensitive bicupin YhaK (pirin superfamily)
LPIRQDARVFATVLAAGESVSHGLAAGRRAWVQVVRGGLRVGDAMQLAAGDAAGIAEQNELCLLADAASEVLVFDLP